MRWWPPRPAHPKEPGWLPGRPRHHRPRWSPLFTGGAARQPLAPTAASIGAFFLLLRYEQPASSGFCLRKTHFLRSGFRTGLKDSRYRGCSPGGVPPVEGGTTYFLALGCAPDALAVVAKQHQRRFRPFLDHPRFRILKGNTTQHGAGRPRPVEKTEGRRAVNLDS